MARIWRRPIGPDLGVRAFSPRQGFCNNDGVVVRASFGTLRASSDVFSSPRRSGEVESSYRPTRATTPRSPSTRMCSPSDSQPITFSRNRALCGEAALFMPKGYGPASRSWIWAEKAAASPTTATRPAQCSIKTPGRSPIPGIRGALSSKSYARVGSSRKESSGRRRRGDACTCGRTRNP